MTASQLVYRLLSTDPALTALVGEKIFPVVVPQDVLPPFVRYQLISRPQNVGVLNCAPLVARVQISCYAPVYDLVEQIEQACYVAVNGYEEPDTDTEIAAVDATDLFEEDALLFHRTLDLRVAVPAP
jgi:hypothetical protein